MPIVHRKVSGVSDNAETGKVQPSDWNDSHRLTGGTHGDLVVRSTADSTTGAAYLTSVAAGYVLASAGAGSLPVYTQTPLLIALALGSTLPDPVDPQDGWVWVSATGTTPNRRISLKVRDQSATRELAFITV